MRSKFKWIFTLLVALTMQFSFAQEKTITGVVSDDLGPIAGANVVVKGTTRGTTTDFDGNYAISAKEGEVLEISYVGYANQEVTVGGADSYDVMIKPVQLEGVVVTALGIKRKSDEITSSYQVVKSEEITQAVNPNVVQALTGKVSGLQINTTSSSVNSTNSIVLRGPRSISGNVEALVVIDGAIASATILQQLSPDMIESVNVIKGAQGAALYGSDGVNGVVIVTTKKGTKGDKLSVNLTSSVDFSEIAYLPQTQLRYGQGWDGLHANQENGSWGPAFDGSLQPVGLPQADGSYITVPYSPIEDNIRDFFQTGTIVQTGVNLSAGDLDSGYVNLGLNRTENQFVVPGDELTRYNVIFKAGKRINKWTINGTFNYQTQGVEQANNGDINTGLYNDLLNTPSNVPVELFSHGVNSQHWNVYYKSPYWTLKNKRSNNRNNSILTYLGLSYEVNDNISISYLGNLRFDRNNTWAYNNGFEDGYSATWGATSKDEQSSFLKQTVSRTNYYGDLLVNLNYELTEDFSFKGTFGNNVQDRYLDVHQYGGTDLVIPGLYNDNNITNPYLPSQLDNRYTRYRKFSFFGDVTFGYKDFLYLNATARNDWSSVFDKSNNSFFYPSIGVSFIPTKAIEVLRNNNVLNYAKLSLAYTKVGNDAVAPYAINQTASLGYGFPFSGANAYVLDRFVTDAGITPEFVTTLEGTVNLGFFKDRLTLDASAYKTVTEDLITQTSSGTSTGLINVTKNIGELENTGFEIDLGFTPIKNDNFEWYNRLSYSTYKTEVTKLTDESNSVELRNAGIVGIFAEVGEEFPLIKGQTYLKDEFGRTIVDANGNPSIDPTFKTLGKANPDYIINYNTTFSYKGFKLGLTLDFRTGHQFYSNVKSNLAFTGQLYETGGNRSGFILPNSSFDYNGDGVIQQTEANTSVVTGSTIGSYLNYYTSSSLYRGAADNFVLDATALKVRELALSYEINPKLLKQTGLTSIIVGVNARNFYTWLPAQNRGYSDPEAAEATGNLTSGLAFTNRYPAQATYGFSVNVKF